MIVLERSVDARFSIEPVGVFSSLKKALKYVNELDDMTIQEDDVQILYDVLEYAIDSEPPLIQFLKEEKKKQEDEVESIIMDLMSKGLVDQLVGEDGCFYYELTDLGRKMTQQGGIADNVKKFFKKKK